MLTARGFNGGANGHGEGLGGLLGGPSRGGAATLKTPWYPPPAFEDQAGHQTRTLYQTTVTEKKPTSAAT
jgi:hypothetical protein